MSITSQHDSARFLGMPAMKKKVEPEVVRSYPYWVEPPAPGQDLNEIEWGVMEVLSDKTLRFVHTNPDPKELEELIASIQNHML